MKKVLIIISLLTLSTLAQAAPSESFMSIAEQDTYMVNVAKNIRRQYWAQGHEDVSSSTQFMSKENLDAHVDSSNEYEDNLYSDEISQLYKCHYSKSCELYLVGVSGSYWGGYGESAHFILLYTKSKKHFEISHIVYAE